MAGRVVVTNAGSLALRYRVRAAAITPAMVAAERKNMEIAKKIAIENSSGRFYRLGGILVGKKRIYPYSRRTPQPPGPPHIANVQSGQMAASWRTQVQATADQIVSTLYNTSDHSRFFNGQPTRYMIARPLLQDVMMKMRSLRFQAIAAAKSRALASGGADGGAGGGAGIGSIGLALLAGVAFGTAGGITGGVGP
jgi:hypothetical protein